MKMLIYKSISLGDIYYGHHHGIWQTGSNNKSGPVGYSNPPGSIVIVKCQENNHWYLMGLSTCFPRKIEGNSRPWPSYEDMDKDPEYVAEVLFCPMVNSPKSFEESELESIVGDLSKYKIGGVHEIDDEVASIILS